MAIKAKFLSGQKEVKLDALHQWDCGQQLEIESEDIFPALVEVHFSCSGMSEAKVCACSVETGVAKVNIPDSCLEQSGNITAWIYEIVGNQGTTTKSIVIPIINRARPDRSGDITVEPTYAEQLIGEINEALEDLRSGNIVVKKAESADKANEATKTTTNPERANSANIADVATVATYASSDTSKGTIEDRLTAMGFNQLGAVTIASDVTNGAEILENKLYKRGKCVYGDLNVDFFPGLMIENKTDYFRIGSFPTGFIPKVDQQYKVYVNLMSIGVTTNFVDGVCTAVVDDNQNLYITGVTGIIVGICIHFGYETK